ncbi:hypothetical protein [Chordicoccus furentiruminis]|uniref:hypothetical protein n=1 Tax=Chordicoccus furentiruminis TaxID=2709410 RepID=UPI0023A8FB37|nr:hypothetical protein [Chordicoccus furentiruminis]
MYNRDAINRLVAYIQHFDGIGDKEKLSSMVKKEFNLVQDRKVFYSPDFAIRFSKAKSKRMSNTVLSLSALQKYDGEPFIVCVVTPDTNYLMLANSTFLKKISHSSQELRIDNIRGSFNGSDIMLEYDSIDNAPDNFQRLFAYHAGLSFQDNLERLVESTNDIVGRNLKFPVSSMEERNILLSVDRAERFLQSPEYVDLNNDLDSRVSRVQGEIAIAAFIDNVNMRGRVIEYLITDDGSTLKDKIINALHSSSPLPIFKTEDKLGDYSKTYPSYITETDIKTKVLFLDGNPKAYNIDKLLEFLSTQKSVYMIYLLGIDENKNIVARLVSAFDDRLIGATNLQQHWAGRNSRGVAQFNGKALVSILEQVNGSSINHYEAQAFLKQLIDR